MIFGLPPKPALRSRSWACRPHPPRRAVGAALLDIPRLFMRLLQLRWSQWPCFRGQDDSRKLRRCAVLSVRASTRVNFHAVLRLSLDVVLNAADAFSNSNSNSNSEPHLFLSFKKSGPHSKMSPASRWRDNIFTVGSNPQPGSPSGLTFCGYICDT